MEIMNDGGIGKEMGRYVFYIYVINILNVYYTDFIAGDTIPSTHRSSNTAQKRGFYLLQSRMSKWEKCLLTFERMLTHKTLNPSNFVLETIRSDFWQRLN